MIKKTEFDMRVQSLSAQLSDEQRKQYRRLAEQYRDMKGRALQVELVSLFFNLAFPSLSEITADWKDKELTVAG